MTEPFTGTNQSLVTDFQGQSQSSAYIVVYEVFLQDSNIGGTGIDKLYFHDGRKGTADIQWYSLDDEANFGSETAGDYSLVTYTALPMESEGWEVRGTGSLPRPTVRMANVNSYWSGYLTDFDDLVGAKVIRRRTLEKYIYGGSAVSTVPVEFNRDVFYIERKSNETATIVEFELTSAFDVEGVKLPRRSIIAARCPWKYKDTNQGGCNWPEDNVYNGTTLYFDKDDTRITVDTGTPSATEYTYWGRQDLEASREANLYVAKSYSIGNYIEYQRPIGSLYTITNMEELATDRVTITVSTAPASAFAVGEFIVINGATDASWNHKNVPLYIESKTSTTLVVQTDSSATGTLSTTGYIQGCRPTLYKCITAHSITTGDSIDDLVKPTNVSYWEFGDVCGKRLSSCAKRFGHVANSGSVIAVHIKDVNGVLAQGDGYSSAPTVIIADPTSGTTATATAVLTGDKVLKFTINEKGSGYDENPTVTIAAPTGSGTQVTALAEARVRFQATDNVNLPFGGFPGAALY